MSKFFEAAADELLYPEVERHMACGMDSPVYRAAYADCDADRLIRDAIKKRLKGKRE